MNAYSNSCGSPTAFGGWPSGHCLWGLYYVCHRTSALIPGRRHYLRAPSSTTAAWRGVRPCHPSSAPLLFQLPCCDPPPHLAKNIGLSELHLSNLFVFLHGLCHLHLPALSSSIGSRCPSARCQRRPRNSAPLMNVHAHFLSASPWIYFYALG